MNPWRHGSVTRNPYYRTAFRVARVPREVVRHRTLVQLIGQTKRILSTDARCHTLQGEPVTEAALNLAEQVLLDPRQRIVEELIEHAAEHPPLADVRKLAGELAQVFAAEGTSEIRSDGLLALAGELIDSFLQQAPKPDPSFGALELDLVPPFGRPGGA